jgi:N4-(beta-N-acetylglucosaminyl)-L-asparaginase
MKPAIVATWKFGMEAARVGVRVLQAKGSALDAVEEAVKAVENDVTNRSVGLGGYPNMEGEVELDASIMDGLTMKAGAVAAVKNVRHPISLARKVMEETPHVMLVGEGAYKLARMLGFEYHIPLQPEAERAWEENLRRVAALKPERGTLEFWAKALYEHRAHDTIGVVAIDGRGNIAAGASTSGWAFKMPGRVGDSSIIGSGTYADSFTGGASATGLGENIMRYCVTRMVVEYIYKGLNTQEAAESVMKRILTREPSVRKVSVVALDAKGRPGASTTDESFEYAFMSIDMAEPELRRAPEVKSP